MLLRPLISASMAMLITACATTSAPVPSLAEPPAYPSDEWLAVNVPLYIERAEIRPTRENQAMAEELQALWLRRQRENAKMDQVDRELTLAWGNRGRGGAALRQPAYIHVLGDSLNARYDLDEESFLTPPETARAATVATSPERNWVTSGASMYELQRWERFCDQGRGMDEPDWRFVTQAGGREQIPDLFMVDCSPPDHDLGDYLNAWTAFCEFEDTTAQQRQIVRNSSRPRSVVNPCRALN